MDTQNMHEYTRIKLKEIDSTNLYASRNIDNFSDRTVIIAEKQTNGRGRFSRKWITDINSDDIFMSIILKPESFNLYPAHNLTQYLALILADTLKDEFNIEAKIKWPNDILINNAKISGILSEVINKDNKPYAIILGLGVNVNMSDEVISSIDQKAISIRKILNKNIDVEILTNKIIDNFFTTYNEFTKQGFNFIKEKYIKKCEFLGKNITIRSLTETNEYIAKSVDDDGFLLVVDKMNNTNKIIAGDVLC